MATSKTGPVIFDSNMTSADRKLVKVMAKAHLLNLWDGRNEVSILTHPETKIRFVYLVKKSRRGGEPHTDILPMYEPATDSVYKKGAKAPFFYTYKGLFGDRKMNIGNHGCTCEGCLRDFAKIIGMKLKIPRARYGEKASALLISIHNSISIKTAVKVDGSSRSGKIVRRMREAVAYRHHWQEWCPVHGTTDHSEIDVAD